MKRKVSHPKGGLPKRRRVQYLPAKDGKVEQSHKDECDINTMVARARRGTFIPPANRGMYGDFSNMPDFQTSKNIVLAAEAMFFALPADLRERFENDPGKALAFMDNPDNREECYKLGLLARIPGEEAKLESGTPENTETPSEEAQEASEA